MICKNCNRDKIIKNGKLCKSCMYIKRHKDNVEEILNEEKWNIEEIYNILDSLLYEEKEYLNDILELLNNKSIEDLVDILDTKLKIGGNVKQNIKINCYTCGKEMCRHKGDLKYERLYCSLECRDYYRSKHFCGENSASYNRKIVMCTNCGKEFSVPQNRLNNTNSFGETNLFCSHECYGEYRRKYYIGEKHHMYGKEVPPHLIEEFNKRMSKFMSEGKMPTTLTKPHIKVNNILDDIKINYENEHNLKYYLLDVYLKDFKLGIEIMGDYWHSNPIKYDFKNLNETQKKRIEKDKSKHGFILNHRKFEVLYIWENDIIHQYDMCKKLIELYIGNNGILKDYNSFNYHSVNNDIELNEDIIYPYFTLQNP